MKIKERFTKNWMPNEEFNGLWATVLIAFIALVTISSVGIIIARFWNAIM